MEQELVKVDMDLINQLRNEGRGIEANNLIKQYHKNKKKNKLQYQKELFNNGLKKIRQIHKKHNKCILCCRDAVEGRTRCQFHLDKNNEYIKNKHEIN
jgi:hypothetical protein